MRWRCCASVCLLRPRLCGGLLAMDGNYKPPPLARLSPLPPPRTNMDSLSASENSQSNSPITTISSDELRQDVTEEGTRPAAGSPFISTDPQNTDIISSIRRLHADELAWLAQHKRPVVKVGEGFLPKVRKMVYQYVYYLWKTWWRCWWGLVVLPGSKYFLGAH